MPQKTPTFFKNIFVLNPPERSFQIVFRNFSQEDEGKKKILNAWEFFVTSAIFRDEPTFADLS